MTLGLALALALAASPRTDLTIVCGDCFGVQVDLDGQRLLHIEGLGGARVQDGKLDTSKDARFQALMPGAHHLRVEVLHGPLNPSLAYDGPVFLRPGAKMVLRVKPGGGLEDLAPPPAPAVALPDGGAPPLQPARLVLRADDAGDCAVALDGTVRGTFGKERVLQLDGLSPGLHQLELRSLQGATLLKGTLFLGSGEEAVGGVRCQSAALALDSDPHAFTPGASTRQPGSAHAR